MKDDRQDDLAAFGIIATDIPKEETPDEFEVWEENAEAVSMFLRLSTQWRTGGMGGLLGLDYVALFPVLALYDIKDPRACFERLRVMEMAVLSKIHEDS